MLTLGARSDIAIGKRGFAKGNHVSANSAKAAFGGGEPNGHHCHVEYVYKRKG
jgi:hypothetical protein